MLIDAAMWPPNVNFSGHIAGNNLINSRFDIHRRHRYFR
jgi:hypothetical protein